DPRSLSGDFSGLFGRDQQPGTTLRVATAAGGSRSGVLAFGRARQGRLEGDSRLGRQRPILDVQQLLVCARPGGGSLETHATGLQSQSAAAMLGTDPANGLDVG